MRHHPSKVNRAVLLVLGLLLLLTGAVGALIATDLATTLTQEAGLGELRPPATADPVLGEGLLGVLATVAAATVIIVAGLLLAVLALAWLVRQVPRRRLAAPLRLHDDPQTGLTRVAAPVLTTAVERQVEQFAGVAESTAQLRGSAAEPELTLQVTADERTDIAALLARIQHDVLSDLRTALDTDVTRLAVRIEVDHDAATVGHLTR